MDRWDKKYTASTTAPGTAAQVLTDNLHLLPKQARAIDLACGLGANAVLLAQQGYEVHAWDSSSVAVSRLTSHASEKGYNINAVQRDIVEYPPEANSWDIIVVSHFLDRRLFQHISNALKPGGLLFYQTFTRFKVTPGGPDNPNFLLGENELLHVFNDLAVRYYREEADLGDCSLGSRNRAFLIAQK